MGTARSSTIARVSLDDSTFLAEAQNTTNADADLGNVWDKRGFLRATLVVSNEGGSNGATYTLQGSLDGANWVDVPASGLTINPTGNIAHNAHAVIAVGDYWPFLRIHVKDQAGGSHTSVSAVGAAITG